MKGCFETAAVVVGSWAAALPALALASDPGAPRGVGPEFAKFYPSEGVFTCISHPSITIDHSRINDDYCDCPDGSDEPGTAACSYLSPQSFRLPYLSAVSVAEGPVEGAAAPALPGFYCQNKGHIAAYVPSDYVNDGKCDYENCCDGSDEWAAAGGIKCEDRCKAMNKEWRKQEEIREKGRRDAIAAKERLLIEAEVQRKSVSTLILSAQGELETLRAREVELKIKLEETERRERSKLVKGSGASGKLGVLTGLAKQRVEELRGALAGVLEERTSMAARISELESILRTFQEEHNPNFNDEGVKRAVKAWQDYAANKADPQQVSGGAEGDKDLQEIVQPDTATSGINWAEWEGAEEEDGDVEALYRIEGYLPAPLREWIATKLSALREVLVANGILAARSSSGGESKAVIDARAAHTTVVNDVVNKEQALTTLQADLLAEYGPQDIWRALKETCISSPSGEYEYELCFMRHTQQKSRKGGGGATNMGNFARLGSIHVDEEMPADGKGLGSGQRTTMEFEGGLHCWNGPDRSTTVVLACAVENEIWRVREEEKCKYRMEVGTPAVCDGGEVKGKNKDEL